MAEGQLRRAAATRSIAGAQPCEEKGLLLKEYIHAVWTHSDIVRQLNGAQTVKIFQSTFVQAQEAFTECAKVKSEFEKHCKTHGC